MTDGPFVSYAQNGEDVLLWRALGQVENGRYVDVGAWSPIEHSVTKAFYEHGWRGIDVEPTPDMAQLLRDDRPEDEVVEAAVTSSGDSTVTIHHILETGLSTLLDDVASVHQADGREIEERVVPALPLTELMSRSRFAGQDIHFLKVDVEGAERSVLESADLTTFRPWVVLVEATAPLSTRPTHELWEDVVVDAGYEFCIFDGLSRYYVASEHAELKEALSYPVCVFDEFVRADQLDVHRQVEGLRIDRDQAVLDASVLWDDVKHWRQVALDGWAHGFERREAETAELDHLRTRYAEVNERLASLRDRHQRLRRKYLALKNRVVARRADVRSLQGELESLRASSSWRVTRPLRWVRDQPPFRPGAQPPR